ncbi:hypothetical protein [Robertkochia aurantiaca]|uniref:hypothetical protein n=1 Tax=Robertkochia aurantiaca TaxID=2873700 RepID=UPI001CCBB791|nr:hypothetical protein [Robertkochia sp. 3YJGBD-33]
MELVKHIETLLEKYFEAATSIREEEELKAYFSGDEVAPHLEEYRPLFNYFSVAQEETYSKEIPLKPATSRGYLKWISVAAAVAVTMGIFFDQQSSPSLEEQYTQEEIRSAQLALSMFSKNFSKGTDGLSYLTEFEKNTNKFLTNEK